MTNRILPENNNAQNRNQTDSHNTHDTASPLSDQAYRPFGSQLELVLRQMCHNRLSAINWFRTDWQRGGALTGYATYENDNGQQQPVVVKLPVPPLERLWLERLQNSDNVVPTLYANGQSLGQYDLAWVIMEQLPHGPLGSAWKGKEFDLLVNAAGRFYAAAAEYPVDGPPPKSDWAKVLDRARKQISRHNLPDKQQWNNILKKSNRKIKDWIQIWDNRKTDQWCHGDLHLANAMTRTAPPEGPALLIDFAKIHHGHWVEDAIDFEHLYWSQPNRLDGRKLCKAFAHERKQLGLQADRDWPRLASVVRALFAIRTLIIMEQEGSPSHLSAALAILERELS